MIVRASKKWQHTFNALQTANSAVGGKIGKQFSIADSEEPADLERSFSPAATDTEKAYARDFLDYSFVGEGFDLTIDRGDAYWEGPREVLSEAEIQRRREALKAVHLALGLV